jgi:hypothetical protein
VPEGLVAQVVSNIIPLELIELFLIKAILNFSITWKTKQEVVMFHPGFANHFNHIKVQRNLLVG